MKAMDLQIIFISSGQMQSEEGRTFVSTVRAYAESEGLRFVLRPHPSERNAKILNGYQIDKATASDFFEGDRDNTLLIGAFSSLMYQAAFKGFRTIWMLNEGGFDPSFFPFLVDLTNAAFIKADEMVPGKLSSFVLTPREDVSLDSVSFRLDDLLQATFSR